MTFKTLDDLDFRGKRVLTRVDLNAPVKDGRVTDDTRLRAVVPTIRDIIARGGKPILLAHFGRPKGRRELSMSLEQIKSPLAQALGVPVDFYSDCVGEDAGKMAEYLPAGHVLLLENTRFHSGEEANDPAFAAELAKLGDVYCNDAFSAAHRAHASTEGVAHLLPSCAGRLMQAELEALGKALGDPERPLVAVVGGAKVSTKLELLGNLIERVDQLVVGGAMANTFLLATGLPVGESLVEAEMVATARSILEKAKAQGCQVVLPIDVVAAERFEAGAPHVVVRVADTSAGSMILDIGPETAQDLQARFESARTVVWNGPLGAFELEPFDRGTLSAARVVGRLTQSGRLLSVAGGGDTVAALNRAGVSSQFSFVSTAGGAFLEWLEGKTLPGVAALEVKA